MASRHSLLKQKVVRARSGGSCAAKYVSTVIDYWRVSALVRDVYWTGSESYRLVENRSRRLGGAMQVVTVCLTTCCCQHLGVSIDSPYMCVQPSSIRKDRPDQRWQIVVWQRCTGGPGLWPGSSKELASRFGEVEVGCKRSQSTERHGSTGRLQECAGSKLL